jgi:DNA-directed RNA polymerase specialized sigma subunit
MDMKEFVGMLRNKRPDAVETSWYRLNAHRFPHQVAALQRIRFRRPDLYEAGMISLVNWAVEQIEASEAGVVETAASRRIWREMKRKGN